MAGILFLRQESQFDNPFFAAYNLLTRFRENENHLLCEAKGDKAMSQQAVAQVIGRAVVDAEFRDLLFSDPDQALVGYDLTMEERQAILATKSKHLKDFAGKLDPRITKAKFEI